METINGVNCISENVVCAKLQASEYKGCINGKTDTILLQWPLCSSGQ